MPRRQWSSAWRGATYEIDLTEEHAKELRGSLDLFVQHARRTSRRKVGHQDIYKRTRLTPDSRLVRAWAQEQGLTVSSAGRISKTVLHAYAAAH